MTRDELLKKRWVGYELIEYRPFRKENLVIECMLLSIDFEQELFKLEPIDKEENEDNSFWVRVEYCKRPAPRLKKVK
jgi:hypothetical protein